MGLCENYIKQHMYTYGALIIYKVTVTWNQRLHSHTGVLVAAKKKGGKERIGTGGGLITLKLGKILVTIAILYIFNLFQSVRLFVCLWH